MQKIILGILTALLFVLTLKSFDKPNEKTTIQESAMLIQDQLKNVGKLIVTEGHFSDVYNYKNSKEIIAGISSEKKAIVVVNAEVTIGYDLSKIEYYINEQSKTISIKNIPKETININPDLQYYDVESGYFNPFDADDYNKIKTTVKQSLLKKIEASKLKTNAQNRLMSELSKFYILTSSMGWTLEYQQQPIKSINLLE